MYDPEKIQTVEECDKALEHFYHRYEDGKINSEQYQIVLKVIKGIRADLKEAQAFIDSVYVWGNSYKIVKEA